MDPERYDRLHELFAATCDLEPQQRTVILDRECAGDPTLRQEVETMLDQDAASRAFLDAPALGEDFDLRDTTTQATPDATLAGQGIGRYHLRRLIASGGMGSVYEAVQEKPHRIVAVKVAAEWWAKLAKEQEAVAKDCPLLIKKACVRVAWA